MLSLLIISAALTGASGVYDDGRDAWTLLDPHLANRNLFEQLRRPSQHYRLGRDLDWFAAASDTGIGGQQPAANNPQSRFHGWFILDNYVAVRPFDFVDVNLNLLILNPSASDGYRISSQIYAGATLHLFYDDWSISGHPLTIDALGSDLGPVTLGQGLLLEQFPIEGEMIGLGYNGLYLRHVFGGRVFWGDDDLIAFALGILDGALELDFVRWQFTEQSGNPSAHYLTLSLDWPITEWFRVSGEYGARVRRSFETAAMFRVDILKTNLVGMDIHVGYQGRYYGRGFGPRSIPSAPTTNWNVPAREDFYVTNSFEFFGLAPLFDQWSHTLMFEVRAPLFDHLFVYLAGEIIRRVASDREGLGLVAYFDDHRAPGSWTQRYYRVGLELYPWMTLPHRVNFFFTNKQVLSGDSVTDPVPNRFSLGEFVVLEAEVFL